MSRATVKMTMNSSYVLISVTLSTGLERMTAYLLGFPGKYIILSWYMVHSIGISMLK